MIVLKFGGTSVGTPERIESIARIIKVFYLKKKIRPVIVVSAFGGVTDLLIQIGYLAAAGNESYLSDLESLKTRIVTTYETLLKKIDHQFKIDIEEYFDNISQLLQGVFMLGELSPRSLDLLQSFGERSSAYIIAEYFKQQKIKADYIDARKWINTDSNFGKAQVDFVKTNKQIRAYLRQNKSTVPIITGFIASNDKGITTTLGRGGSDYTAAIVASAVKAKALEIWTDVNGVLTSDPRKVTKAFTIPNLSYEEAMEMSHFGAKVIYPPTIKPVMDSSIPIYIKNTFNPENEGTRIHFKNSVNQNIKGPIKGISALGKICLITLQGSGIQGVPGIAARFFKCLSDKKINIIMITQASSEQSITIGVNQIDLTKAKEELENEFNSEIQRKRIDPISYEKELSLIAIIGDKMQEQPGVAGKLFSILGKNGVNVEAIAQGSSERNITFAVKQSDEKKALNIIHDAFFVSKAKSVHLFMAGVGLIGGTLLNQIKDNRKKIRVELGLDLKIIGLSNSKKYIIKSDGIDIDQWSNSLSKSRTKANAQSFVNEMIALNLPNSIFVDNTAGYDIPALYGQILNASISITTPNKIATSSSYKQYQILQQTAKKNLVQFRYETNVGAGLPVISTISDLVDSGDKIHKIEAVLSGSLSYIFNHYDSSKSFHDVVMDAKQLGFTEPDPREDLSGADVKRKITILARAAGYPLELNDVTFDGILPDKIDQAKSIDSFLKLLKGKDSHYAELVTKAENSNKKLRFIASFNRGKAKIELKAVNIKSPFYSLSGSENMIAIYSNRYSKSPLVVRGPGAGGEVTAAGVFAEILTISKR